MQKLNLINLIFTFIYLTFYTLIYIIYYLLIWYLPVSEHLEPKYTCLLQSKQYIFISSDAILILCIVAIIASSDLSDLSDAAWLIASSATLIQYGTGPPW